MSKKPLEDVATGVHRAKLWEIAFYALNNTSTNVYMMVVGSISYFLVGIVGVGAVLAGSIVTLLRVWDGVTDPFVGMAVDNTNTKFGKNRPFILLGQIILFTTTFVMFRFLPVIPTGGRFVAFILIYMIYIIGYTCQCVVTKSAQTCLTNDPQQRPMFSMFDSTYNIILMSVFWPLFLSGTLVPQFTLNMTEHADQLNALIAQSPNLANCVKDGVLSGLYNPALWQHMQLVMGVVSAVFATCGIIGLWRKDNSKYYGLGKAAKVSFKDYADVLAHNRGIQMLVLAASSDKLAANCTGNTSVLIALYGIIFGNFALSGSVSAITGVPTALIGILGIGILARKMGQKQCLVIGTWGSIISAVILGVMIFFGRGGNMVLPTFNLTKLETYGNLINPASWSIFGLIFCLVFVVMKGFSTMSGSIVIPMTADCADYEVYRSGRYVPGLMGTLFSFVDKVISSLAATIVSLVYAAIGYTNSLPAENDPYSMGIMICTLICFLGMPMIGWLLNVVAMKFYPLSKEKMESIQDDIARIKAEAAKQ
ncbi:MAG: MFS transporter [Clostridia bacterium]|nr:MFS transporter [Clostridia bacterium]